MTEFEESIARSISLIANDIDELLQQSIKNIKIDNEREAQNQVLKNKELEIRELELNAHIKEIDSRNNNQDAVISQLQSEIASLKEALIAQSNK